MASSVKRNNELFPAVVAGDLLARQTLIEENMALVVVKADSLIKRLPLLHYLRDDLISAGYVGLVSGVNEIAQGRLKDGRTVTKYLGESALHAMLLLLPHEKTIYVSWYSSYVARNPASVPWDPRPIDPPAVANIIPESIEAPQSYAVVELRDTLAACCKSDLDRDLLRLREEGYTLIEIAAQLHVPKTTLQEALAHLRARVNKALEI